MCRLANANAQKEARSICVFVCLICFHCCFCLVCVLSVLLSACLLVHCGLWYFFLFGQNWNASGFLRETEIAHSAWEAALYLNGAQLSACSSFPFPTNFLLCNRFDRSQRKLKCIVDIFYAFSTTLLS